MDGLVDLARRDGVDIKPTLLRVLTDLYVQSPIHTADEEAQFSELACRLLRSADADTRANIAARLRSYPRAPMAVLKALAEAEEIPAANEEAATPVAKPDAVMVASAASQAADEAELEELFGADPPDHADLAEQFFRASSEERVAILRNLEFAPIEPALVPSGPRVADAFARMEKAALAARKIALTAELGALLHLSRSLADRIVQDKGGEALCCALRAAGMPVKTYQRVLLFLDPTIGQSVSKVFALERLYRDITPRAAQIMLAIWRGASARGFGARHQPMLQDDQRRIRAQAVQAPAPSASRSNLTPERSKSGS